MKINKRKLKVKAKKYRRRIRRELPKLFKLSLVFVFLYAVWQSGRLYEYNEQKRKLQEIFKDSRVTYYFLDPEIVDPFVNAVNDPFIYGEIGAGRCTTIEGKRLLDSYNLLE